MLKEEDSTQGSRKRGSHNPVRNTTMAVAQDKVHSILTTVTIE